MLTNIPPNPGVIQVCEPAGTNQPARFYRVRVGL